MKLKSNKLNLLYSYAYLKEDANLEKALLRLSSMGLINLLIDSGAFTAFKSGKPIVLKDYIERCKFYDGQCFQYVALDVINEKDATRDNLNTMVQAGLKPMPVVTADEDTSISSEYVIINEYMSVGGGVFNKGDWVKQRFQQVYKHSGNKAKIHGLGYVTFPDMYKLPLHTVDASSATSGRRFGTISIFDPHRGLTSFTIKDLKQSNPLDIPRQLRKAYIDAGLWPKERYKAELYKGMESFNCGQTYYAHLQLQRYSETQGLNYSIAETTFNAVSMLSAIMYSIKVNGKYERTFTNDTYNKIHQEYLKEGTTKQLEEILT